MGIRSEFGRIGVRWVEFGDDVELGANTVIVAKQDESVNREWLAYGLAKLTGLEVPREMHFVPHVSGDMAQVLGGEPSCPVLLMSRVLGRSFDELSPQDKADLFHRTPRGESLVAQLGKVCAYDYFIGNGDRFPLGGLGGVNRGNLMVEGDVLVCIDNTLILPKNAASQGFRETYDKRVKAALALFDGHSQYGEDQVKGVVDFFASRASMSWSASREVFLAGFRDGIRAVAAISQERLRTLIDGEDSVRRVDADTAVFLSENLASFRRAVGAAN